MKLKWKNVSPHSGEEIEEDAPTNAVAHGAVDMNPNGGPKKKKEYDGRTKAYKEHRKKLEASRVARVKKIESQRKSKFIESVKNSLLEKYDIYHKDYSSAVQHALSQVKKQGYEVDQDDYHNKVTTGPKKPSSGKNNSFSIMLTKAGKPQRKALQMQIYNTGKSYELNMYIQ